MAKRKKLGEVLMEVGLISPSQRENALILQSTKDKPLGKILIELGYVNEDQVADAISRQFSIPFVDCNKCQLSKELLALIPKEIAETKVVLPVELLDKKLVVAMAYPLDWQTVDDIAFITGRRIQVVVASENSIRHAVEKYYTSPENLLDVIREIPIQEKVEFFRGQKSEKVEEEKINIQTVDKLSEAPIIVKLVTMILVDAAKARASDIHIEPGEKDIRVRYRVDGELKNMLRYPIHIHDSVVTRIKVISDLDITNKRLPQDGRTLLRLEGKDIDIRISTLPSVYGEKVVLRLLDHTTGLVPLSKLGIPENTLKILLTLISQPQGMILVTGPTGSGKTTTLYAVLQQLQSETKNIITIEDPVEYRVHGTTQVGINEAVGLTFSTVLRHVLRQDPDTILIGEIRDLDTAEIATRAALTGHLVLSTVHTNNTIATITRLIDIGLEPYLVASSITGILAQRLVRRICENCKVEMIPPEIVPELEVPKIKKFFKGRGCRECKYTGFKGRVGVYEFLVLNQELKRLIARGCTEEELWSTARSADMVTLFEDGWSKIEAGITTVDEIISKIPYEKPAAGKEPTSHKH